LGKILEALALTRAEGEMPLRALIETQVKHMVRGSTVVLITPASTAEIALIVDFLVQRGLKPIVVLLDAASFGGEQSADELIGRIQMLGIPHRVIKHEMDLSTALSSG
jgi:hypothetical protein